MPEMGMKRREFFRFATGAAVVPRVRTERQEIYRGYLIHWHGWRDLPNQLARVGFWTASKGQLGQYEVHVSTTLGMVYRLGAEFDVIDLTHLKGWQIMYAVSPPEAQEYVKERARVNLLKYLDGL